MKTRDGHEQTMSKGTDEDEEELEALRLAALESLRAKGLPPPILSIYKPSPPVMPQVFQRHSANQNLIAIVPVEVPPVSIPVAKMGSDNIKKCSPVHQPQTNTAVPHTIKKDVPHRDSTYSSMQVKNEVKLILPQDRYTMNNCNDQLDEKPKPNNKFSRFDDSESEDSEHDEIEISFTQSDEDEEIEEVEIVVMDDGDIIEEMKIEEIIEDDHPESSSKPTPASVNEHQPASARCTRVGQESSRRRGDSPPPTREPSRRESPSRHDSHRSPKRRRPSPYSSAHRKPTVSSRVERFHQEERRSHDRNPSERSGSTDPSSCRSNRPADRKRRLDDKKRSLRSASRERSSPSLDRRRQEADDKRRKSHPADSRATEGRENHKKSERIAADSPDRRSPQLSESERERLESRKRKFGNGDTIDPLKRTGGKIRLKVGDSGEPERREPQRTAQEPPEKIRTPPPKSPDRLNGKDVRTRDVKEADPQPRDKDSKDRRAEKKSKRAKDKKKDKDKRKTPDLKGVLDDQKEQRRAKSPADAGANEDRQGDLRAELQRRRNHRVDDEEQQRQVRTTPEKSESRRILVLKSPPCRPPSAEPAVTVKNRLDDLPSKASTASSCMGSSSVATDPSASSVVSTSAATAPMRSAVMTKQRTSLLASAKVQVKDQGRDSMDLEDRIRQIRAKNDEIRRRQLEVEADRLKYA